jgi:hypothetical protein
MWYFRLWRSVLAWTSGSGERPRRLRSEYWCGKYGCTPEQLKAAVKKVGVMAKDVEKELKGK